MTTELPTGTVTFLFTDIQGSTRLLQELGERYRALQDDHMRLMREAIAEGEGIEIRTEGDAFFAVFPSAPGAVRAAVAAQRSLASHPWSHGEPLRVRMGLHTGEGRLGGDDYLGIDVNRAARIAAAGHGGQVLISDATRAVVAAALPEGVRLEDLGSHRLKDLRDLEHLHQLVIEGLDFEFPPLKTLEIPSSVPAELTSFVGREREVERIKGLMQETRLLTLTGPGGAGKTRLAVRTASELKERFRDGVFVCELASITEPQLVPSAIASALRIRDGGPRPIQEALENELQDRESLIVLDNFEQVVDAAPVVGSLLRAAPYLRFLVTSRTALHVAGEREFPVPPLGLPASSERPSPGEALRSEAVALFAERATAVDPGFAVTEDNAEAVAAICVRLDGLPLAIELAASRVRLLTPAAMLERLDRALPLLAGSSRDLSDRQRTLRGAIAWSFDLLPPELRGLFRRLSVFAGGFTLDTAQPVVDPENELGVDVLEGLDALLDHSLLRRRVDTPGQLRFDMLQTIREFGQERLDDEDNAEAVRRRHAEFFLAMAEAAEPQLRGPAGQGSFMGLMAESDNLRAVLEWVIQAGQGELGLRLVAAVWRVWHWGGDLSAGRRWAEQVLAPPSAQGRTVHRARALAALGGLAYWQQDAPAVRTAYGEALSIAEELGDAVLIAEGTYARGRASVELGQLESARALFLGILDGAAAMGDRTSLAIIFDNLADEEIGRGRPLRAMRLAGASAALKEAVGGQAPPELISLGDPRAAAADALTPEEIEAAWEEGHAMSVDAVVAYARAED